MDFYRIRERPARNGVVDIYPDFKVTRSKDLMVRGKQFYAIWDEEKQLWSDDEYDVPRIIDADLKRYAEENKHRIEGIISVKYMDDFSSNTWLQFRNYIGHLSDSAHQLDENLVFSNTEIKKTDYVSRRLPYPLAPGDCSAFLEILNTLYEPEEAEKILWAIGAVVSGDSKTIQKFLVFYGAPGSGKGTIINIIQKLFEGYYTTFDAKTLTSSSGFAAEAFRANPLVAIDPDGDLSKIEDNTKLNSIVSHENMTINEKYKPSYMARLNAFLFMASNKAVKITDAKSGLIRRLIDVHPSGALLSPKRYQALFSQIDFELGAIAHYCLEAYRKMGKNYYSGYRPIEMMLQTDVVFNYIETYYDLFKSQDGVSLDQAHKLWKEFIEDSQINWPMPKYKLREELKNYFKKYEDRVMVDGVRVRSWFSEFTAELYKTPVDEDKTTFSLVMDERVSLLDDELAYFPAQLANKNGTPPKFWDKSERLMKDPADGVEKLMVPPDDLVVDTVLSDIDTSRVHYVKPPLNHIVIDFDLADADGNKSAELNLEAASTWPPTYAEYSKSGAGVHLHYIYDGDVADLERVYDDGIEIKVFTGNSSLRRRLSKCNNIPVATINSGLPLKEKKVINVEGLKSEKSLRNMIERNMRKEIHPGTKPSIDFIHKILSDAYDSDMVFNVEDMRPRLLAFANNSTNQAPYCLKVVMNMKFKSEEVDPNPISSDEVARRDQEAMENSPITFFDVEVFPNLFIISYKYLGADTVVRMTNPTSMQVGELFNLKLVGYNNRRYDNHILYGAFLGYNNEQLYDLSQRIISNAPGALFGEAYNISYADIYDFSSKKQSLKKFQIELGLKHDELGFPWDEPVPEDQWERVGEYCDNDVLSTEEVFKDREQDFVARQILAELSGLSVNDTTQKHTARIVFQGDRDYKDEFVYTDLSEMFPGYKYDFGESTYKGEITGEGGYVDAEPGIYEEVVLLDVESMHPTSIKQLNLFGKYTDNFWDLVQARLAIKHKDYDAAAKMLNGQLAPYLGTPEQAKALSYALKIVINIVYGLTSAKFDNPFKDPRNIDNIVAKRGALFMIDLKHYLQELGFPPVHIKTDSVKIPGADEKVIQLVMEFGKKYGYNFEHEKTYSKMALVNDAVYIARVGWSSDGPEEVGKWTATGKQFKHPYVFKKLFSHEPIVFRDLCEEKQVATAMYLDFDSHTVPMAFDRSTKEDLQFIGKTGLFCPMIEGKGGGLLMRQDKLDKDKFHAVTGTKGFFWMEAEMVKNLHKAHDINLEYFETLVNEAIDTIEKYGRFEDFVDYIDDSPVVIDGETVPASDLDFAA
ncbi:DNA primase/polymerase [Arthrobacter phage GoCrazy]|uniref:DNA primase/polymerase n=1 Tax=Arthrobacter phage KeaneyLin TaxID=2250412 RepID=A0A345KME6_9CAUD|nr:DNA primase/polymerase [Arthrobacter phage KeaneyLin]AXH44198.1 DNA primase/polymerase [Arthrobacter phage KeaneyLin]QXO13559.1 DNA primase/polymerase [Arthrobacter phage GoCrazy]